MEITQLIPHRPPMLLVDKIIELNLETKNICAIKKVSTDEFFLQGHYPDFKIVPGVITCEMLFQTGAALISSLLLKEELIDLQNQVPVITRSHNIKFKNMILPTDEVLLKVELNETVGPAYYLKGRAEVNGKMAASVDFTCMLAPKPKPEDRPNL